MKHNIFFGFLLICSVSFHGQDNILIKTKPVSSKEIINDTLLNLYFEFLQNIKSKKIETKLSYLTL